MPATIEEVLAEADRVLEPGRFRDYCVNGLQVPGAGEVSRIVTGVSANLELIELAASGRADLLLVHHGLFWGDGVRAIDAVLAGRLRVLFGAGIALAAYHLPLDAHPHIGNNALLAQALGASRQEPFALHGGEPIGVLAELPADGTAIDALLAQVMGATGREPRRFGSGPDSVARLAIVSGAGADYLEDAAAAGADALLTGEIAERSPALADEAGVHLIEAGHHATERLGIRRLGSDLADRFGLEHHFIDVPNPV